MSATYGLTRGMELIEMEGYLRIPDGEETPEQIVVKIMSRRFFEYLSKELIDIWCNAPWADFDLKVRTRILNLRRALEFLSLFGDCVEVWERDDEGSRSTITAFDMLWVKSSVKSRLIDTWPVDAQAFNLLLFEVQGFIQKMKPLVENWCEYHLACSMQPENPDSPPTILSFKRFQTIIDKAAKIIPFFKKQMDILIDKIRFMEKVMSNPVAASCTDSNKHFRLKKFTAAFDNKATCLALLYWAKQDTATEAEMSILLFNTLHSLIPYAPDVIVLISQNLQRSSSDYSIILSATVASLVGFFFEHSVDDDNHFLILRDPLIRLFTSLTHHNASPEEEEHRLRSQAYALFSEHSYLLLPHGDMKEVFSDKNKIRHLRDFMSQIEITNAKIRQLYHGGISDSFVSYEAEKLGHIYFVSIARELYLLEDRVQGVDPISISIYRMELRFMTVFCQCFATWELAANEDISARLNFIITCLQGIWQKDEAEKGILAARFRAIRGGNITDWHPLAFELEGKIQTSKIEIQAWCTSLFHLSFQSKPSTSNQIVRLLDSILDIVNDLVNHKAGEIVPFKKEIEILDEKLLFLKNVLILTTNCTQDSKELGGFRMFVQAFASDAACLTFLCWAKNGNIASEVSPMLSHTLQKITPVTPDVARLYLETLKAIYLQHCDSLLFGQTASIFVDFFLENLRGTPTKDDFHDEVIFLLTFLNDPPTNRNSGEVIDDLFWEDVYGFLPFDDVEEDFITKKIHLSDFILKIGTVNAKIRHLYCEFPDSSLFNFPKLVSPSFLDFIIHNVRNLKERMISDRKYAPFAKYKIIKIEEELVSIRPFFIKIQDRHNQSELKETWSDVVDFVHLTEHVISSSISSWFVFDHPIWYHMGNLSDVIDRIKVFKTKLEKMTENTMYNARSLPPSASIISTTSEQSRPSQINELVVGFEDVAEKIIGMLTRGSMLLDTVSIVGIGGSGKTTIAKKVYGSVKCDFNVYAFCTISQDYNTRRLLIDILIDLNESDKDRLSTMTNEELAHKLKQCLSRQKYLIVLDDIWDVSAWKNVKSSFPDCKNGSRILFTTRHKNVANMCKISSDPHPLRDLSPDESWELFRRKVFHDGISPPYLYEIGRKISASCKGLPLAVAIIAGLLARTDKRLEWWREVAENVVSYFYSEGCMKILELSYMHLPEILKPCLLYLTSFPEDSLIRVKKVILLWIAEGFVPMSMEKSLEEKAKDYFHDLVDRSLVIVSRRSSNGGIKEFRVHDLIYELCRKKCREGNFSVLNHGPEFSGFSDDSKIESEHVYVRNHFGYVAHTLKFRDREFSLRELRLVQVLYFDKYEKFDAEKLTSLVHLRYVDAYFWEYRFSLGGWYENSRKYIPQSICNIWNIRSLILKDSGSRSIHLPATFWRMKSLRHVQVDKCILHFSDGRDEHEAYPKLDKVIHFSEAVLFSGKDVQRLLQRLPAVQKLSCSLVISPNNDSESVEILDFDSEALESLKLYRWKGKRQHLIHFPPTLKKLTLIGLELMWKDISAIAELHCLEVLKLRNFSIPETVWEMEELTFRNLKFIELCGVKLVEWKASTDSLPRLEQLVIEYCEELEELPSCFLEIPTLKRIVLKEAAEALKISAFQIQDEQREMGIEVEVDVSIK